MKKRTIAMVLVLITICSALMMTSCGKSKYVGTWYDAWDPQSYLEIYDDGSCTYFFDCGSGVQEYNGTYEVNGDSITLELDNTTIYLNYQKTDDYQKLSYDDYIFVDDFDVAYKLSWSM